MRNPTEHPPVLTASNTPDPKRTSAQVTEASGAHLETFLRRADKIWFRARQAPPLLGSVIVTVESLVVRV